MALQYFIMAFLALQGVSGYELTHKTQVDINRGIIDEFKKLIQALKETIQEAMDQIFAIGKEIYDKLSEEILGYIKEALAKLEKVIEEVKQRIEELKEIAANLGEEAITCVRNEEDNIEALNEAAIVANGKCVAVVKAGAHELIVEGFVIIADAKANLAELLAAWNACSSIVCQIGVAVDAKRDIEEIVANVTAFTPKVPEFFKTAIPELKLCVGTNIQEHAAGMEAIVGRVQVCLDEIESKKSK